MIVETIGDKPIIYAKECITEIARCLVGKFLEISAAILLCVAVKEIFCDFSEKNADCNCSAVSGSKSSVYLFNILLSLYCRS